MCRMLNSGTAPNKPQFGLWSAFQQHQAWPQSSARTGRRRYKYEARLGVGKNGGTMYRARCERGELWAIEVIQEGKNAQRHWSKVKHEAEDEPWMQTVGEQETYLDMKTGDRCIVTRLPKESMRQRIVNASYGLELVLRWARQLASAVVGSEDMSLDNVWLDEADCILVGDYTSGAYYTDLYDDDDDEEEEESDDEEEGSDEEEEMGRKEEDEMVKKSAQDKQMPTVNVHIKTEVVGERELEQQQQWQHHHRQQQHRLFREEDLKRYGVLMYQIATKTPIPGDLATAYRQILMSSEAKDEASGKQALLQLLSQRLPTRAGHGEQIQSSQEVTAAMTCLATIIADALMGKSYLAKDLLGAIPPSIEEAAALEVPSSPSWKAEDKMDTSRAVDCSIDGGIALNKSFAKYRVSPMPTSTSGALCSILKALRQTRDSKMRQRTLVALGKLGMKAGEPEVIHVVVEVMLRDADPINRRLAACSLGAMGPVAAQIGVVTPLIKALTDVDATVRAAAAWALGNMGKVCQDQGAYATLMHRSVKDQDQQVRAMSAKSLERLGKLTGSKRRCDEISSAATAAALTAAGSSRSSAYYAKRRPICLSSATLSMSQASITGLSTEGTARSVTPSAYVISNLHHPSPLYQQQPQQQASSQHTAAPAVVAAPSSAASASSAHQTTYFYTTAAYQTVHSSAAAVSTSTAATN